jgi:hypothetical protein
MDEESFWSKDTSLEIRVEANFSELAEGEKAGLAGYLIGDGSFHIARIARLGSEADSESDQEESKISVSQQYLKQVPQPEWLQEESINSARIKDEWWKNREGLVVGGVSFGNLLGTKQPSVGEWKERAKEFIEAHTGEIPMQNRWIDNPKGYANVLKGALPFLFRPFGTSRTK